MANALAILDPEKAVLEAKAQIEADAYDLYGVESKRDELNQQIVQSIKDGKTCHTLFYWTGHANTKAFINICNDLREKGFYIDFTYANNWHELYGIIKNAPAVKIYASKAAFENRNAVSRALLLFSKVINRVCFALLSQDVPEYKALSASPAAQLKFLGQQQNRTWDEITQELEGELRLKAVAVRSAFERAVNCLDIKPISLDPLRAAFNRQADAIELLQEYVNISRVNVIAGEEKLLGETLDRLASRVGEWIDLSLKTTNCGIGARREVLDTRLRLE